jgi:glycosyltransferase involved in cell wall biosynthesis
MRLIRRIKKALQALRRTFAKKRLAKIAEMYLVPPALMPMLRRKGGSETSLQMARADEERLQHLKDSLWMGFSARAARELEELQLDPTRSPSAAYDAAKILGYWHASFGRYQEALRHSVFMRAAARSRDDEKARTLLEADCHMAIGHREHARFVLEAVAGRSPRDTDYHLAFCNTYAAYDGTTSAEDDAERLTRINSIFRLHKLAPLELIDPSRPLRLDNIRGRVAAPAPDGVSASDGAPQPRVTVIVPAFRCETTLGTALRGLVEQTWENLEILVVDDQSPDGTWAVAQEFAARDPRIKPLKMPQNAGSYSARNLALQHATGDFVTTHDSDDWSHPQKIELQARHLAKHPEVPANITQWVRCFEHLYFRSTARRSPTHVTLNHSSLMFRRSLIAQIGAWDRVRIAADAEFISRIEAFARRKVSRRLAGVPLSFALDSHESLTREGHTHVFTIFHGVRRVYHDASSFWRASTTQGHPIMPELETGRAFPAPHPILPGRPSAPELDLLFIFDFAMAGGAYVSTRNYVEAAIKLGRRVGIFHYPRFDLNPNRVLNDQMRHLIHEQSIYRVAPGEKVRADIVVVGYPVILRDVIDRPPVIECDRFVIVTNQMNARLYSGGDVQYDPREISANVRHMFGAEPTWIPISDLVRGLMERDGRYAPIHSENWTPLIDTLTWCKRVPKWRGESGAQPTVGRHGRDHYTKWPTNAESLAAAYCVNQACRVSFLGGARHAIDTLGSEPRNWDVHAFGSLDIREFLSKLDFYVHFPHEDYIEEFGRAVLEAMAVGVPVVLPPVFRSTFGEAALYAEPSGVWPLISKVWASKEAWAERVEAGRRFVLGNSDWERFEQRIAKLLPVGEKAS